MNKYIKKELSKVKETRVEFDDNSTHIFIPKKQVIKLLVDNYYIVKLSDTIIDPPEGSTLVSNWNNNSIPPFRFYKIDVTQLIGNMIKVNGIAYDPDTKTNLNSMWSGWLPINEVEILEQLK